jgi:hypothetical protein
MEILIAILAIIAGLLITVAYQSRKDKPDAKTFMQRLSHLVIIIFSLFKDIGICIAKKVQAVNWDLTYDYNEGQGDATPQTGTLPPSTPQSGAGPIKKRLPSVSKASWK